MPEVAEPVIESVAPKRTRIESVDLVRGVIMILMALDHVRDFFGVPGSNPTDLANATAPLFFTRWITHFCAPFFFCLPALSLFVVAKEIQTRIVTIPIHSRPLADFPRPGGDAGFRVEF